MSRICIVTTRNIFDAPCLDKYKNLITEDFDIIYWDRCDISEDCGAVNYYKFNGKANSDASKMTKMFLYFKFLIFAKKILKKNDYKKLIVFPSQTAWLILNELKGRYKKKYIFDIRDYAGENNKLINKMTATAVENSSVCSITSEAYKSFLPEGEYVVSHNIQNIEQTLIDEYRLRNRGDGPIVLSFIGSVRFIEQQKRLIRLFGNDERFEIRYIGRGSEQLADFCEKGNYKNVRLIGRFDRSQLGMFYSESDMAINVYGNNDPYLDYALSNKLYSAAMMGMPILVSPKTYMAEITEKYNMGIAVDLDDCNAPEKVYKYFKEIDEKTLFLNCEEFLAQVKKDEEKYTETILKDLAIDF